MMSAVFGEAIEEGRAAVASFITQVIAIVRRIIEYALEVGRRFMQYVGEHPLAAILTIANICVWMSP